MLALLLAVPLALDPLAAAPAHFALKGTVLDPSRAPVAAARVVAISIDHRLTPSTQTDGRGEFELLLAPGTYSVRVTAGGFLQGEQSVTALDTGSDSREFVLKLAPFGETVTVNAGREYAVAVISSATRTPTRLLDVPQAITVTSKELVRDQLMLSVGDVMRYTPGISVHQGENNRDQVIIRGQSSSADFFLNGVRDDVQYYRDLYNLERVEALKGPNAMTFGRGGGGGVVNRVTKEALFQPVREATLQGGGYGHKRIAGDFDQPLNDTVAVRLNAMYESSDSFRDSVDLERYGVNPTLTIAAGQSTRLTLGYEHLHDRRVADRGITSFQGLPADVLISTYYGNPDDSRVRADVDLASATVEHQAGQLTLRNRTLFGAYDRAYQNYVPGAVNASQTLVTLTAYNNATRRDNLFNQADAIYSLTTGRVRHTLLGGLELGLQDTDNFRNTGFFGDTATSIQVPYASPTISTPVTFRQSATDADNHVDTNVVATYVQDQLELSPSVQLVAGLRFDRFDLTYHNNRNGDTLGRVDNLLSPRAGIVVKPAEAVSLYGSYTVSHLPSSGDQFSSLTTITDQLEPEKFTSYELGAKWEPHAGLALNAAVVPARPHEHALHRPQRPDAHRPDGQPANERRRARGHRPPDLGLARRRWLQLPGRLRDERHRRRPRGRPGGPGASPHVLAVEPLSGPVPPGRRRGHPVSDGHVRDDRQHRHAARLHARRPRALLRAHPGAPDPGQPGERIRHEVLVERGQQHEHLPGLPADAAGGAHGGVLGPNNSLDRSHSAVRLGRRWAARASTDSESVIGALHGRQDGSQVPVQPHRRRRHLEPRLVAEPAAARDPAPALVPVQSDGRGLRLRRGVQEPRLRGPEEGPARADDRLAGLVAGGLRSLRAAVHPHGLAQRRHLPHR